MNRQTFWSHQIEKDEEYQTAGINPIKYTVSYLIDYQHDQTFAEEVKGP